MPTFVVTISTAITADIATTNMTRSLQLMNIKAAYYNRCYIHHGERPECSIAYQVEEDK